MEGHHHRQHCVDCQRGWTLIPEVEQMGVLVRFDKNITVWWWRDYWAANSGDDRLHPGVGTTPEEALAHAIYQVHDLSNYHQ